MADGGKSDQSGGSNFNSNVYYNGDTAFRPSTKRAPRQGRQTCGSEVFRVPHRHGRYQVANFERVVHEGEHWKGKRGIISLYLNREILQHFEKHGRKYFDRNRQKLVAATASRAESPAFVGSDGKDAVQPMNIDAPTAAELVAENGYKVVDAANFDAIENASKTLLPKTKLTPIFQQFEFNPDGTAINADKPDVGDGLRVQGKSISARSPLGKAANEALAVTISDPIVEDLVFIGRRKDCVEQHHHRDAKHGWFFILPLSDNYTVRGWRGTHAPAEEVLAQMDSGVDYNDTEGELLTLQKGQLAIFDARLIHAGGRARMLTPLFSEKLGLQDVALHGFLKDRNAPVRKKNVTCPVYPHVPVQGLTALLSEAPGRDEPGYNTWEADH